MSSGDIYTRFWTKLYRQIVGIPMGTNCAPLVADLFLHCYERDFMDSLNHDNKADVIEALNSTFRYLYDLLSIPYFELISKFNVGLKTRLHERLSKPEFHGLQI